jgi:hypothetical protein
LDYNEGSKSIKKSPERHMTYDLLKRVLETSKQDGINFPITDFRGDFVYFASAEFAMPLIGLVRDILDKIGSEAIEDLNFLHSEYITQIRYGNISDTSVQQRIFKEAYERKLEFELVKAGLIKPQLTTIK